MIFLADVRTRISVTVFVIFLAEVRTRISVSAGRAQKENVQGQRTCVHACAYILSKLKEVDGLHSGGLHSGGLLSAALALADSGRALAWASALPSQNCHAISTSRGLDTKTGFYCQMKSVK